MGRNMMPLAMWMALGVYSSNVTTPSQAEIDISMAKHWSIAPFRAPSSAHPLGTIAVAGVEEGDALVIEWDLAENCEIHRRKVAESIEHATMTSNGEHLFLAVGSDRDVVLIELDASLGVVARRELHAKDKNDKGLKMFVSPRKLAGDPWNHALDGRRCQNGVVAWNHPVTICAEQDRSAVLVTR